MANSRDRGFNTVQNSRIVRRQKTDNLQKYTFAAVGCMLVLTVALLVTMAIGGLVGGDGNSPLGERVEDAGIEVGTIVRVKYLGLDKKGRMDFSIKDAD